MQLFTLKKNKYNGRRKGRDCVVVIGDDDLEARNRAYAATGDPDWNDSEASSCELLNIVAPARVVMMALEIVAE